MRSPASTTVWSVLRLVMGLVIVAAIVTQLSATVATTLELERDMGTTIANFFSFFTILSNVIAAVTLVWAGIAELRSGADGAATSGAAAAASARLSIVLACASTSMIITGLVYNLLLRGLTLPQGSEPVPWSNEVLHLIGPLFLLLDVLIGLVRRALPWRAIWTIIAFPILWTVYTLVRGPLVTNPASGDPWWYPYPFLNPNNPGGWPSVIVYVAIISVAFVAVGAFVVWVGRRRAASASVPA